MISFNDWEKKNKNYTLTKGSNGLPLFVLDNPLTQDDDREVEVITDLEIEIEIDEPKEKSVVQQVSDYITRHF